MDKVYIKEAAKLYASQFTEPSYVKTVKDLQEYAATDFIAGVKWMQDRMEEIKLTENR